MNEDVEKEIWKTYTEFDLIQGSNLGNVRTLDRYVMRKDERKQFVKGHVLKQYRMKNGYMEAVFGVNGKTVHLRVHRVIASCFLPNTDGLPEVNHKDCDPTNNTVSNLEWCTHKQNIAYREKYGVSAKEAFGRPVVAINLKTLEVLQFESQREAARQLGASDGRINDVLKGRQKTTHGYWFIDADDNAVESTRVKFGDSVADKVAKLMAEIN